MGGMEGWKRNLGEDCFHNVLRGQGELVERRKEQHVGGSRPPREIGTYRDGERGGDHREREGGKRRFRPALFRDGPSKQPCFGSTYTRLVGKAGKGVASIRLGDAGGTPLGSIKIAFRFFVEWRRRATSHRDQLLISSCSSVFWLERSIIALEGVSASCSPTLISYSPYSPHPLTPEQLLPSSLATPPARSTPHLPPIPNRLASLYFASWTNLRTSTFSILQSRERGEEGEDLGFGVRGAKAIGGVLVRGVGARGRGVDELGRGGWRMDLYTGDG